MNDEDVVLPKRRVLLKLPNPVMFLMNDEDIVLPE